MEELLKRLESYPGAHPGETWKLDEDLTHCTESEKDMINRLGLTIYDFMAKGLNRGQVHHILIGHRFAK